MFLDPADSVEGDGLASDPDVAHLLAELQSEFDAAINSGDSDRDEEEDNDIDEAYENEACENEAAGEERAGTTEGNCTASEKGEHAAEITAESGSDFQEEGVSTSAPLLDHHREQARRRHGAARSVTGERQHSATCSSVPRKEEQGRLDISRIKIDRFEGDARAGGEPRPLSAPSVCLSAGGFSRLSRTSSSHLSRTVSQKLLQVAKEAERASSEVAPDAGCVLRQKQGSPVVSQVDARIHVVKQNADALQV